MSQNTHTNIDIGFAVRQKLSELDVTVAWLARRIDYDRSNLCKLLKNTNIYPELLLKISIALKTNFFEYYSQYCQHLIENEHDTYMW